MKPGELLPHQGSALLLSEILSADRGEIRALGFIPTSYPLVTAGQAPGLLGIELGAQAAGALEALGGQTQGRRTGGRLVRIEEATFVKPVLPAGCTLEISATREALAVPLAKYRIEVRCQDELCVTALLSVYLVDVP